MKKKVIELYIEENSDRHAKWTQLVAKTEDGKEYTIHGSYCGGIPSSHWEEIEPDKCASCKQPLSIINKKKGKGVEPICNTKTCSLFNQLPATVATQNGGSNDRS